ncbi:esterase family protein [Micromonospora sp. R77]|uniref:alpha/beta hydrolase n=1 Tax=Micromonospora sp. R77 TaxID=2925836 RepID=UPI001F621428|nr:alpha/beta hydrolase-fold protein [Micromonospora sp. R77]MCI4066827.1 esterase family protein [Micromonospora sp. R77]
MGPDSLPLLGALAGLTVLAPVLAAALWDRGRRRGRTAVRVATTALCLLTLASTVLVAANRQAETYPSWSDLLGSSQGRQAVPADPRSAQDRAPGRFVTIRVTGAASGVSLPVLAYLPAAYDAAPDLRFPVVEAFDGFPGSPGSWIRGLGVAGFLDGEISAGRMAPTVVLFPPQTTDPAVDTECTNLAGGPRMESFLTVDVPAAARAQLRVRGDRAGWGVIGYSAGGYCAANLLLRHPGTYAAGASLSGYADPGIRVGDGSETTTNDDLWRLRHLSLPAVALYLSCARTDLHAMRDETALAALAHAPISLTTAFLPVGGHNMQTWRALEPSAFDWLSSWLAAPTTTGARAVAVPVHPLPPR